MKKVMLSLICLFFISCKDTGKERQHKEIPRLKLSEEKETGNIRQSAMSTPAVLLQDTKAETKVYKAGDQPNKLAIKKGTILLCASLVQSDGLIRCTLGPHRIKVDKALV